jgi:hypothetical protein
MVDMSKGCPNCGCIQFEKDGLFMARPKYVVYAVLTIGFWWLWLIIKYTFKGCPYRCIACKKYLSW